MSNSLAFDPLLPLWAIAVLLVLALIGSAATGTAGLRSFIPRALAALAVTAALLNPQTVTEERTALPDVALIITDSSQSMSIGARADDSAALRQALTEQLQAQGGLDVVNITLPPSEDGTRLTPTLIDGLGNLPANRIAGVFAITDGQIHDVPKAPERLLPEGTPFHSLIVGSTSARDRRLNAINAPRFGLVEEIVTFDVRVDDPGFEGEPARIQIKLNGDVQSTLTVNIGEEVSLPVTVERRGSNTVEIVAEGMEGELTYLNNVFVQDLSGIRDRLRVLLITGEPHSGGRAWRNLLKSDPSVDLIQFSILRPPGKSVGATTNEMSLIAFPVRELFEEKLDEFDLIIFDQYRRRNILSPYYIQNIARYVDDGGALLVAAGPPYATSQSLYRSPLATVLPARPTGELLEEPFRPALSEKGKRHPITAGFDGQIAERWGRWFRAIDANVLSGDVLMEAPDGKPLLILDDIGEGRTALLLSDQAWLWAKGFEGGGPYNEMFRRLAHWLMGEPDLEAERLSATITNGTLEIERNTLEDRPQSVRVIGPDGQPKIVRLTRTGPGQYQGQAPATDQGAYRIESGEINAIAAAGALNPKEFSILTPSADILRPLSEATGGLIAMMDDQDYALPGLRGVDPGDRTSGADWAGVIQHGRYDVTASKREPFLPTWVFFILAGLGLAWGWRQEGR